MTKARALVVDDDDGVRYTLAGILEDEGVEVEQAADGEEALDKLRPGGFHLVVTDLRMPRMDGLALLDRIRQEALALEVVVLTAHGSERHAVEAMKKGAFDYFRKPFEPDELVVAVRRAIRSVHRRAEEERAASEESLSRFLVFRSDAMGRLAVLVRRVAPRDVTVLLTGESGTGKELVAEALVRESRRADKPFVRFNCAALNAELADAELFGHTRGAFTGAHRARKGLFREADGGTLLLDEIGELEASTQGRLLRVLQEGEVRPVGEDRAFPVDVRIVAATHRDLRRLVAEGRFREDLYYRLNVVHLQVPPLRERPEDIPVLAHHFLSRAARRFAVPEPELGDSLMERLLGWPWPGNARELENVIEGMVALSPGDRLDPSLVPLETPGTAAGVGCPPGATDPRLPLRERLDAFERHLIAEALVATNGNRLRAAEDLGISRATLYDKLRKHDIE